MKDHAALAGILIMGAVAVGTALDAAIVRLLAGEIHPVMLTFTRTLFGLLALVPFLVRRPEILRTRARFSHVLRAALKLGSLMTLFVALQNAPLATVTAISFAAPFFLALGAWLFLGEVPGLSRLTGLILGFVGILVILAPAIGVAQGSALLLAVASALMTALIQLMLKVMGRADSALTLVTWNLIVCTVLALVPATWFWTWPTAWQWAILAVQGAMGTLCQLGVTRALQLADASLVAPVDFLRLPMVALIGWVAFGQVPASATYWGGAIVFIGILVLTAGARGLRTSGADAEPL
ncbi:DMT family transporter [Sinirhodobacter populi]|uniref:DMT family transporter n=1 Tax=Paenirhodobacter populi TaxID=2306993 RepID=A0A443K2U0_9RHOB|nr:DMT family transporter [Sinirhodobacter populi]RWR27076.1 DMT family transporter [Sinirhodobacter populi]